MLTEVLLAAACSCLGAVGEDPPCAQQVQGFREDLVAFHLAMGGFALALESRPL